MDSGEPVYFSERWLTHTDLSLETMRTLSRLNSKIFSKSMRGYPADFSRYSSSPGNVGEPSLDCLCFSVGQLSCVQDHDLRGREAHPREGWRPADLPPEDQQRHPDLLPSHRPSPPQPARHQPQAGGGLWQTGLLRLGWYQTKTEILETKILEMWISLSPVYRTCQSDKDMRHQACSTEKVIV